MNHSKKVMLVLVTLMLVACGKEGAQGPQGTAGTAGPAGANGSAGLSITSNNLISAYGTNLCTQFSDEVCGFGGGQLVKYADGSVLVVGIFQFLNATFGDSDQNSLTFLIPPSVNDGYGTLSFLVARGSGYRSLFLTYSRSGDVLSLVHDTNNNSAFDTGDTVITTLNQVNW